jgi:hypothetical protein
MLGRCHKAEFELRKSRRADYYALLGCKKLASAGEIKAAYRGKAGEPFCPTSCTTIAPTMITWRIILQAFRTWCTHQPEGWRRAGSNVRQISG